MAKTMRGCPITWLQSEGKLELETNLNVPQQEGHPYATEGGEIADYNPDVDYEGSEPKDEQVT